jgi:hypothetical protein
LEIDDRLGDDSFPSALHEYAEHLASKGSTADRCYFCISVSPKQYYFSIAGLFNNDFTYLHFWRKF